MMQVQQKKMTIVFVDDEKTVLQSLKEQLKSYYKNQFRYETAYSANEGLEVIDELIHEGYKIILIVSDWLMPGMKGDEFVIRIHEKYPEIQTVLLTAHANQEAIENAKKNANLLACIFKPWNLSDISNVIDLAMEKYNE